MKDSSETDANKDTKSNESKSNDKPSTNATAPRRIIRRRRRRNDQDKPEVPTLDPSLVTKVLRESGLPAAYSFEVVKTVQRIVQLKAHHVALQMPEGLLMYSTVLADVLKRLSQTLQQQQHQQQQQASTSNEKKTGKEAEKENDKETDTNKASITTTTQACCQQVSILGDVTYGACCVGDLDAQALGADLLVHYGHSCLVPLQYTVVPCLYVFVEIQLDVPHLVDSLHLTLVEQTPLQTQLTQSQPVIYLLGTIQFRHVFGQVVQLLREKGYERVLIPQVKPLSPGEVLGCTSPQLHQHTSDERAVCCFVADGRFHLESTLISNQHNGIDAYYRYDPYGKTMTLESYAHEEMKDIRKDAIQQAGLALQQATLNRPVTFGILLGTLGRQGNPAIVQRIREALDRYNEQQSSINGGGRGGPVCRSFVMLLSEITPAKLSLLDENVQVWVQVACPRLSVDWGHFLAAQNKPVLSPYELFVTLQETTWQEAYPMDFYAQTGGPWSNYHAENKARELADHL